MARRTRAREVALQLLYEHDRNPHVAEDRDRSFVASRLRGESLRQFALQLINGVRNHLPELDSAITQHAENWSLARMPLVDRNLLRLAAYEILHCQDVPPKAAIDEAIELAKRFGTADSPRFVNGILDKIFANHPRSDPEESATARLGEGNTRVADAAEC